MSPIWKPSILIFNKESLTFTGILDCYYVEYQNYRIYARQLSISFPSPPITTASNSGDLFQPEAGTPEQPSVLERIAAPVANSLYDHLWSASSPKPSLSPSPSKDHRTESSHPALDRAIQTLQGNYRELQHACRSELSQTRIAVERRMDDLAEAMHNDMRRLRDDALSEAATNHSDVFRCTTTLGHVQDRLARLESAFNSLQDTLRSLHPAFANALSGSQNQLQQQPRNHSPIAVPPP
jgi:hypothetical protein